MTDESIHLLTGAYVADALDGHERAEFETHLEYCADCRTEVGSLREAQASLAELTATDPPADLRSRVLAEIRTVRPLPPETGGGVASGEDTGPDDDPRGSREDDPGGHHAARFGRNRRNRLLLAAASVLAALGIGVGTAVTVLDEDPGPQTPSAQEQVLDRVLSDEESMRISRELAGQGTAEVVHSPDRRRLAFVAHDVPPPPQGKVYELWLQRPNGRMVPAGLMDDPSQPMLIEGSSARVQAVGITVEPEGGSDRPSTDPLAMFTLPGT